MKVPLSLNDPAYVGRYSSNRRISNLVRATHPKPWVAELNVGIRTFIKGQADCSSGQAQIWFWLDDGKEYEVCEVDQRGNKIRYNVRVENGSIARL